MNPGKGFESPLVPPLLAGGEFLDGSQSPDACGLPLAVILKCAPLEMG